MLILTLIFTAAVAYIYFNTYFFPIQLKRIVTQRTKSYIGRDVHIEEIRYVPMRGLFIEGLTIFRKDEPQAALIQVDQINFSIFLPSVLKKKGIVIPAMIIKRPYIHIIREKQSQWNFSDLIEKRSATKSGKTPQLFLGSIVIEGGRIELTDQTQEPAAREIFEQTDINMQLSLTEGMNFKIKTHLASMGEKHGTAELSGTYAPGTQQLKSHLTLAKIDLAKYFPYIYQGTNVELFDSYLGHLDVDVQHKNSVWEARGDIDLDSDIAIHAGMEKVIKGKLKARSLKLTKQESRVDITTAFTLDQSRIVLNNDRIITGDLSSQEVKITARGRDVTVTGNIDLNHADIQIQGNKTIRGELAARRLKYSIVNENVNITGDLVANNAALLFGADGHLEGRIVIQDMSLSKYGQNYDVSGQGEVQNGIFRYGLLVAIEGHLTTDLTTYRYHENDIELETQFQLDNTRIKIKDNKVLTGTFQGQDAYFTSSGKDIQTSGHIIAEKASLTIKDRQTYSAEPVIDIILSYTLGRPESLQYQGSIDVESATIDQFPFVDNVKNIQGKIQFKNDELSSEHLHLVALETPIKLKGTLKGFDQTHLSVQAFSPRLALETWSPIIQDVLDKIKLRPRGPAALDVSYDGPLASAKDAEIKVKADLKQATVEDLQNPPRLKSAVTELAGLFQYFDNSLAWKNLQGIYDGTLYEVSGSLTNLNRPIVKTRIKTDEYDVHTVFKILRGAVSMTELTGDIYQSSLNMKGDIKFQDGAPPRLDLSGSIDLDTADLIHIYPRWQSSWDKAKLKGRLDLQGTFNGAAGDWKNAVIVGTAGGPAFSVMGLHFNHIGIKYNQKDQDTNFSRLNLIADMYSGKMTLDMLANISKEDIPFKFSSQLEDVDLALMKRDTPWTNKDITGKLYFAVDCQGPLTDLNALEGVGAALIKKGHLGKINLLKGIWSLFLIPEYEDIVFTEAHGRFKIANGRAVTKDLLLKSQPVDLYGEGWVDGNRKINLDIMADFKETEILKSQSILKGPTAIITQAEDVVGIKITGTLDHPQHKNIILPGKMIKKTKDVLWDGFKGIVEEILERTQ